MRRVSRFLLCLIVFIGIGIGMPSAYAGIGPIVIGQAISLSGPNASVGRDYVAGITTYFDSVNVNGGINGRKIKYLVRDDRGSPELSTKAVTDLIEKEKVDYLIGGIGTAVIDAVVATPALMHSRHMLFAPLIESVRNYGERVIFWRPGPDQEMQYIFSYFDKLGTRSIGIALQNTADHQEMYHHVVAEIKKRNMALSGTVHLSGAPQQVHAETLALAASGPNIVISIADTVGTGIFLKEFRKHAQKTLVAGMSLTSLETLAEVGGPGTLEWTVFSQVVPNPLGRKVPLQLEHATMMRKFRDEALSALTLEGYVVAKTLCRAIEAGGANNQALQKFRTEKGLLDLGGLLINPSSPDQHLSGYVDIALFRRGVGLLF